MRHLILYDGVCGLCQGLVQFVLRHDHGGRFVFAALQSPLAEEMLRQHGVEHVELNTFYLVANHGGEHPALLDRSDAGVFVLKELGGIYAVARALGVVPRPLRDAVYNVIARNRYAWFGQPGQCLVPDDSVRSRFLDMAQPGV
jgi:predicted DCC family thiol-disulfide oxidoreductase YuxK